MRIPLMVISLALMLPAAASANFLFLIPGGPGQPHSVVWSDGPTPDPKASADAMTAAVAKADGAEVPLEFPKADGVWKMVNLGGAKVAMVKADYGLVNRGEGQVYLIRHAAKWAAAAESNPAEATMPLELTAVRGAGEVKFLATQGTKPLANAEVTVYEPGTGKVRTVKTDANGITPGFTPAGQYSARVHWRDATEGEYEGRKYRGTYYYSTLTVDYRP
jgi:hypothetical protein